MISALSEHPKGVTFAQKLSLLTHLLRSEMGTIAGVRSARIRNGAKFTGKRG
jgi:hypothetical protein